MRGGTQPGYAYKSSIKVGRAFGWGAVRPLRRCPAFGFVGEGRNHRWPEECGGAISYLPIQVSCLGLEGNLQGDPCRFALTSRGPEGGIQRYVLQTADPAVSQAWVKQVAQILESQRDFLNGKALTFSPPPALSAL